MACHTASATSGDKPAAAACSRRAFRTCATLSGAATACASCLGFRRPACATNLLPPCQQADELAVQRVNRLPHFGQGIGQNINIHFSGSLYLNQSCQKNTTISTNTPETMAAA